ncbi:MAG TPA: aldolase/citrate lyase family protein [Chloroflexota bacterium]|nr:aldolase/citrate lyase family protein [Chloroflexota bacterium]
MAESRLRRILSAGGYAAGTMIFEFNTPGVARILDAVGLDFAVYDMEHSGFEIGDIRALLAWSRAATFTPIVRVPSPDYHFLARIHDVGARGVMVPMVGTRAQAEAIVRACKYAPEGARGAAFGVAHDDFRAGSVAATMADANRDNLIIAQIETAQGVEHAAEIAAVPGIDVIWIGHFDLTLSLGIPGQFDHPRFVEAVDIVVAAAVAHGRPLGILVSDPAAGRFWIERGFRIICYSGDIWLLQRALAEGVAWVRSLER